MKGIIAIFLASMLAASGQGFRRAPLDTGVVIRTDVPNKAFFKDLFIDSGVNIFDYGPMPAALALGLGTETLQLVNDDKRDEDIQRSIICGSEEDTNGRLLYPDGEPRFRMIYVYGGLATKHGNSLGEEGRERLRTFYANGGSYTGSCAGAYLSAAGFDGKERSAYLGIWPGLSDEAAIENIYPDYIIPENSPLLKYSDFGGDFKVDSVKHWNGPSFSRWDSVRGTEALAYNSLEGTVLDAKPSIIAYKADCRSGRIVISGGHPERIENGERLDLMCSIMKYAMDGSGCAKVKGILNNGEVRQMNRKTEDNDPDFTVIGDRQCHHFAFRLPVGARRIKVRMETAYGHRLSLRLAKDTFAFAEDAEYSFEGAETVKEMDFKRLPAGIWYVGVQCEDTVDVTQGVEYDGYGRTDVLNGVPYSICVSWK